MTTAFWTFEGSCRHFDRSCKASCTLLQTLDLHYAKDLMMNDDTYFGQVRHWLVTDISADSDGTLKIDQGEEISSYVGPAPLPNYLYSRPHRYVFIVASGSGPIEITPEDLRELQKPYVAAIAGKQGEVQDLVDRWGFNAQKLIEKKGLRVMAANFMLVHGTLGSAATNAGLMGQAAVNKVRYGLLLDFR